MVGYYISNQLCDYSNDNKGEVLIIKIIIKNVPALLITYNLTL